MDAFFTPMGKAWLAMPWMHIKLGFVFLLYVYHLKCHQIFKQLQRDQIKYSASFLDYGMKVPPCYFLLLCLL